MQRSVRVKNKKQKCLYYHLSFDIVKRKESSQDCVFTIKWIKSDVVIAVFLNLTILHWITFEVTLPMFPLSVTERLESWHEKEIHQRTQVWNHYAHLKSLLRFKCVSKTWGGVVLESTTKKGVEEIQVDFWNNNTIN